MTHVKATDFFNWRRSEAYTRENLTGLDTKATLFAYEPNFRDSLYSLASVRQASDSELGDEIRNVGLCVFRPDAIAHNKVKQTLDYFSVVGITPFQFAQIRITPALARELWRYVLNIASGERLQLIGLLFGACDSILVLFEMPRKLNDLPCSVVMTDLKGRSTKVERQGWELRSYLSSPHPVEQYVHTADEPADVVREGGILLGPAALSTALQISPRVDVSESVYSLARRLQAQCDGMTIAAADLHKLLQDLLRTKCGSFWDGTSSTKFGLWEVYRKLGGVCEMFSAPAPCVIDTSGTDWWWEQAGLLENRKVLLSDATSVLRGGQLAHCVGRFRSAAEGFVKW